MGTVEETGGTVPVPTVPEPKGPLPPSGDPIVVVVLCSDDGGLPRETVGRTEGEATPEGEPPTRLRLPVATEVPPLPHEAISRPTAAPAVVIVIASFTEPIVSPWGRCGD